MKYVVMNEDDFIKLIFFIQVSLNNAINVFIELSSNEILYEFKLRESLNLLKADDENSSTFLKEKRVVLRKKAEKAIAFFNAQMKIRYDLIRKSMNLKASDLVYLRLHKEYNQSDLINKKLSKQRLRSIKILKNVDKLIHRLNISVI